MKQFSKVSFLYQSHRGRTGNPVEKLELPNNPSERKQVIRFFEFFDWCRCLWVSRSERRKFRKFSPGRSLAVWPSVRHIAEGGSKSRSPPNSRPAATLYAQNREIDRGGSRSQSPRYSGPSAKPNFHARRFLGVGCWWSYSDQPSEMNMSCPKCGGEVPSHEGRGRPSVYCSATCRRLAELEIRRLQRLLEGLERRRSSARLNGRRKDVEDVGAEIARTEGRLRQLVESGGSAPASDQPQGGAHVA